jgi:hypothetical protein
LHHTNVASSLPFRQEGGKGRGRGREREGEGEGEGERGRVRERWREGEGGERKKYGDIEGLGLGSTTRSELGLNFLTKNRADNQKPLMT